MTRFRDCELNESIRLLRSRIRASGIGTNIISQTLIARAEPVAIYEFPLFILKPEFWSANLNRRLPHHGRFAAEVICDLWLVVCARHEISSSLATSH